MKITSQCKSLLFTGLLLASLFGTSAHAGIAVIVHPGSGVDSLSVSDVKKLFLGKRKKLPDGKKAIPVDQAEGSAIRADFGKKVLGKSADQLKAYWTKIIFSGKGSPPRELADDGAVKAYVADNPGAIGYIDSGSLDSSVKAVLKVE